MRLFIAVPLDDATRDAATRLSDHLQARLGARARDFSWARPESFHLTLKFLGEVEPARLPSVVEAVREACAGIAPFAVVFGALGGFPRLDHPRVLWLGLERGAEPLAALARRVDEELVLRDFPSEERPFAAHLTLARVKSRGHGASRVDGQPVPFAPTPVERVIVYESRLLPGGAVHEARAEFPLGR